MTPYEQTDAMLSERLKAMLLYVSQGATDDDLNAAGYTPEEIATIPKQEAIPFTPREGDTLQKLPDSSGGIFSDPTIDGYIYDPMSLPVEAIPERDQVVGVDADSKLNIRETSSGKRYIIEPGFRPKPISLSERTDNLVESVGSAYGAITKDPLGTATNVVKGVAQGLWDTVSSFSNPDATKQNAMNVAGMMAGASAPTLLNGYDPNVTRIFAGPRAKKFPSEKEGEALLLDMAGESPQKIYEQTGIQFLPQRGLNSKRPIFSIDPAGASIRDFEALQQLVPTISAEQKLKGDVGKVHLPIKDVVDFSELYENYPQLEGFEVAFDPDIKKGNGSFDVNNRQLNLSLASLEDVTPENILDVVLHELQHGVQAVERTSGGASPRWFLDRELEISPRTGKWEKIGPWRTNAGDMTQEVDDLNKLEQAAKDAMKAYTTGTSNNLPPEELDRLARKADFITNVFTTDRKRLEDWAYRKYQENPGELEARAAQLWATLTPEERRKTKPSDVYDRAANEGYATYSTLGEEPVYGDNDMPTARLPANSEEELRKKLNTDAQMLAMQPESAGVPTSKNPFATPKENPTENLLDFYSPIKNSIDTLDFGERGLPGNVILKHLREKTPNTNIAELDSYKLKLDPNTRYTQEDIKDLLPEGDYRVQEVSPRYSSIQRQRLNDDTSEYFELSLQGDEETPFFHLTDKDLAHTRGSFIVGPEKKRLLIEELQSDLLQNVGKTKKLNNPASAFFGDVGFEFEPLKNLGVDTDRLEGIVQDGIDGSLDRETAIIEMYKIFGQKPQSLRGPVSGHLSQLTARKLQEFGYPEADIEDRLWGSIDIDFQNDLISFAAQSKKNAFSSKDFPVNSTTDVTKKLLLGLIAKAQKEGATEIVMPPLSRIAAMRAPDFMQKARGVGQEFMDSAVAAAEKALKPTYVDSFDKATEMLNREFTSPTGNPIRVYEDKIRFRGSEFSRKGNETVKVLDITNFPPLADYKIRFAEGGMVEDEQMNRLMQEGGMASDGMSQEPVTGNEIPPGALASEVRDDVDAKLSGGEYVVPADVLRYYGVRFFEDLRAQAKQGMMEMESAGRIGGVSVDAQGVPMQDQDEELTPEEEQMLAQAMSATSGMAEGGLAFDRTQFNMSDYDNTGTGGTVESRTYFNPITGEKRTISFMGGTALGSIPADFVPWSQALQDTYNNTKPQTTEDTGSSDNSDSSDSENDPTSSSYNYTAWADKNYDSITSNPYQFGMDALDDTKGQGAANLFGLAGGLLPLALSGGNRIQNVAEANAALLRMEAQGLSGTEEYNTLTNKVKDYVSTLSTAEQGLLRTNLAGTGNQYVKALDAKSGTVTPSTPAASPVKQSGGSSSNNSGGSDSSVTSTVKPTTPLKAPTSSITGAGLGVNNPSPNQSSSTTSTVTPRPVPTKAPNTVRPEFVPTKAPITPQGGRAGFASGGLVMKPQKTNPKTKGLGGKL